MTAEEYLLTHGISEQFALDQGLAWDENYLNIPVKDEDGNLLFIKSRNLNFEQGGKEPKYKNSAGSHATLFNYHAVRDAPNIILCEGEIDALRLMQSGIPAVSSTGGAATFNTDWVELLGTKNLWICLDNDEAGIKATRPLLKLFPNAKVIQLPDNIKDICDYFQAGHTEAEFLKLTTLSKSEWETTHLPEDFETISAEEINKLELKQEPWLIENILYSEGFCFIYGAEGTGKSYLTLSIAEAVASGTDWLNQFKVPKATPVLFLDKENPLSMTKRRLAGLNILSPNIHWLRFPEKFQLSDGKGNPSEFALALSDVVKSKQIGLIIIDSFVDIMVGSESSAEDTQRFFEGIRSLFPQIAYLPLHHENKPAQGVTRSPSQRLRGSSNINAQTFTQFRLEAVANSKTEMTLKQTKARDALKLDKFMLRMTVKDLEDSKTTISGFEYLGAVAEDIDNSKDTQAKEAIKDMLTTADRVSRQEILTSANQLGFSDRTAVRALDDLLAINEIQKLKDGKEVWYTIVNLSGLDFE